MTEADVYNSGDLVQRLRGVDVCSVSDALDRLGLFGVLDGVLPMSATARVAGRAITVELGPVTEHRPSRHLCTAAVDAAGPDDVIVVAHQARRDCAGWGGNLSRAAKHRGVAGTIVHGSVRDTDESRDVGYPVFAMGSTPRTARGRVQELSWGATVQLGDVSVATGDYVIGDGSGVVVVGASDAERVITTAAEICAIEAKMAAAIERGQPVDDVMGRDYENMTKGRA